MSKDTFTIEISISEAMTAVEALNDYLDKKVFRPDRDRGEAEAVRERIKRGANEYAREVTREEKALARSRWAR